MDVAHKSVGNWGGWSLVNLYALQYFLQYHALPGYSFWYAANISQQTSRKQTQNSYNAPIGPYYPSHDTHPNF